MVSAEDLTKTAPRKDFEANPCVAFDCTTSGYVTLHPSARAVNSQAPRELGLSSPKLIFVCGSFSVARNHTTRSPLIDRVSKVDLGPRREFRGTTGISVELTLLQDVSLQFQLLWCVVARDIACCVLRVMLCFVAGSPVQTPGPQGVLWIAVQHGRVVKLAAVLRKRS